MTSATRTISFLKQQRIEVQAVRVEWNQLHGRDGEIRLTDFNREGLDLPGKAQVWLEARTPLGRERKCVGTFGTSNYSVTIPLHEDFKSTTTVKIYVTSHTRERQILATVKKPIPLVESSGQHTGGLLGREWGDGLVGLPFELQFRSEGVVLVLNRAWEDCNLMNYTEGPVFHSIVSGDIIRQIAIRVGNESSELSDDVRAAWRRCFEQTYGCPKPPATEATSGAEQDLELTDSLERWAKEVAGKIALNRDFKEMFKQQMTGES